MIANTLQQQENKAVEETKKKKYKAWLINQTTTPAAYSQQLEKRGLSVLLGLGNCYYDLLCMPRSVEWNGR